MIFNIQIANTKFPSRGGADFQIYPCTKDFYCLFKCFIWLLYTQTTYWSETCSNWSGKWGESFIYTNFYSSKWILVKHNMLLTSCNTFEC